MMKEKVLLVPECGGEAGFDCIQWYKEHRPDWIIIGLDSREDLPASHLCDVFYKVPLCSDERFVETIQTICSDEGVTDLIPTFEWGIDLWKDIVREFGLSCCLDFDNALLFKDKYETWKWCEKEGVKTIETALLKTLPEDWGFSPYQPVYIKPRTGSGSKKNYSCTQTHHVELLTPYLLAVDGLEEYIVQPFTQGTYWSVDVCVGENDTVISCKRVRCMNGSKVISSEIVLDPKIRLFVENFLERSSMKGVCNIELIQNGSGIVLLEVNTRLSGSTLYSVLSGMHSYDFCVTGVLPEGSIAGNVLWYKHTMPGKAQKVQGVKAIIEHAGSVLLTKRRDVPFWTLPGGGIDQGEKSSEAVKREVFEEVGYKAETIQTCAHIVQEGKNTKSYDVFTCSYGGSALKKQDEEVAEMGFFSLDNLPYPVDGTTRMILERRKVSYHKKNVHVDYRHERFLLASKPARAIIIIMKLFWNSITSSTFKI